jgi:serine protease Do
VSLGVTLESMNKNDRGEDAADASKGKPRWGIGLADLSADARQQLQADDSVRGAVIAKVVPGSPADNAGLQPGDIITEVNRHPVQSASDVQKALSSVANGSDAMVLVWSHGGSSFRVLHPSQG